MSDTGSADFSWLLAELETLRRKHLEVEDCYYSCPLSDDGCCNDNLVQGGCNCGAERHNATIDAIVHRLRP